MIKECFKDIWLIRKILLMVLTPLVLLPLPLIDGTPVSFAVKQYISYMLIYDNYFNTCLSRPVKPIFFFI